MKMKRFAASAAALAILTVALPAAAAGDNGAQAALGPVELTFNGTPVPFADAAPFAADGERVAVAGGILWLWLPHGVAKSRLAAAVTPKRVGIGTARNWNTMRRIAALLDA